MTRRSWLIDGLKVVASQLIVLHHITLYAPMAELVAPDWPRLGAWLADQARYAVQVFLVLGGFLAAQSLARREPSLPRLLLTRAQRLVPMPAVALLAVLAASALLPPGRWPDWVTPWPSAVAFAAQLLLLQDVLGIDSLSAGAWYVSIDLQSYALLAIGATLAHRRPDLPLWRSALPWAVAALTLASLWVFNRNAALDAWALYFFGAYGLGALAAWAPRSRALAVLFAGVCIAQLAAAALEPRPRGAGLPDRDRAGHPGLAPARAARVGARAGLLRRRLVRRFRHPLRGHRRGQRVVAALAAAHGRRRVRPVAADLGRQPGSRRGAAPGCGRAAGAIGPRRAQPIAGG
jgi:peptidoglycan/LPS O-acetylase OafA/YrhL